MGFPCVFNATMKQRQRRTVSLAILLLLIAGVVLWVALQPREARPPAGNLNSEKSSAPDAGAPLVTPDGKDAPLEQQDHARGAQEEVADKEIIDLPEDLGGADDGAAKPLPVTLSLPDWKRNYVVRSTVEVRLFGRVVNGAGLPVMGAKIVVDGWAMADVGEVPEGMTVSPARTYFDDTQVATTDTDGWFDVVVSLPMDFEKTAMAGLGVYAVGEYGQSAEQEYDWYEGHKDTEIELVIPSKGGVSGRCVDTWGVGATNVTVRVHDISTDGKVVQSTRVAGDGTFEIRDLVPGEYMLSVSSSEWSGPGEEIVFEVFPDVVSELAFELTLTPRRRVELTLRKDGKPFYGVDLVVRYVLADETVTEKKCRAFNTGLLRLLDPPDNAVQLILMVPEHETLEVVLPDLQARQLYELGTFQVRNLG